MLRLGWFNVFGAWALATEVEGFDFEVCCDAAEKVMQHLRVEYDVLCEVQWSDH